jgi:hypothetical protein
LGLKSIVLELDLHTDVVKVLLGIHAQKLRFVAGQDVLVLELLHVVLNLIFCKPSYQLHEHIFFIFSFVSQKQAVLPFSVFEKLFEFAEPVDVVDKHQHFVLSRDRMDALAFVRLNKNVVVFDLIEEAP